MQTYQYIALCFLGVTCLLSSALAQCNSVEKTGVDTCISAFATANPSVKNTGNDTECHEENMRDNCITFKIMKACLKLVNGIDGDCRNTTNMELLDEKIYCSWEVIAAEACDATLIRYSTIALVISFFVSRFM